MKFWEILKAVDEGKTVQFFSEADNRWKTPIMVIDNWVVGLAKRQEWRIKPVPREFQIAINKTTGHLVDYDHNTQWITSHPLTYEILTVVEKTNGT